MKNSLKEIKPEEARNIIASLATEEEKKLMKPMLEKAEKSNVNPKYFFKTAAELCKQMGLKNFLKLAFTDTLGMASLIGVRSENYLKNQNKLNGKTKTMD